MAYRTRNRISEQQQHNANPQTATAQFADKRTSTAKQLEQQTLMAESAFTTEQRAVVNAMNTSAVQQQKIIQRAAPGEELQMKSIHYTVQLAGMDEEELLQGKFETAQRLEDEELLQGKFETAQRAEDEELLQGKFEPVEKPNNTGLPDNLKSGIENLSGMSMDHVKVHYNSEKPAQLQAHAYAQGSEIHVAPGQEKHLPHEAWHVVQQAQGRVKPTVQMKGNVQVNDDAGLETEADVMGEVALSGGGTSQLSVQVPIGASRASNTLVSQLACSEPEKAELFVLANELYDKHSLSMLISEFKENAEKIIDGSKNAKSANKELKNWAAKLGKEVIARRQEMLNELALMRASAASSGSAMHVPAVDPGLPLGVSSSSSSSSSSSGISSPAVPDDGKESSPASSSRKRHTKHNHKKFIPDEQAPVAAAPALAGWSGLARNLVINPSSSSSSSSSPPAASNHPVINAAYAFMSSPGAVNTSGDWDLTVQQVQDVLSEWHDRHGGVSVEPQRRPGHHSNGMMLIHLNYHGRSYHANINNTEPGGSLEGAFLDVWKDAGLVVVH